MFEVRQYTREQVLEWDNFVQRSKQGTFLFNRSYMDYHADRFLDCSLMVYRKGRLYALLPANKVDTTLYSHQGLTYGGLLTNTKACVEDVCKVFLVINEYLYKQGFKHVVYKSIPWIYHKYPAEEDLYALLNVCKARLTIRDISTTIPLLQHLKFTESRKSGIRKATHSELTIAESGNMEAFWGILNDNLSNKYNTHPVHSLAELKLLKSRFPKSIRLFMAFNKVGNPLGGTLIFETPQVIHTQYISASPEGKSLGALDLLFDHLINKVYADRQGYFDFGKSTEENGRKLNAPLIFQKEGFGGRGVCYDCYEWDVMPMAMLNNPVSKGKKGHN